MCRESTVTRCVFRPAPLNSLALLGQKRFCFFCRWFRRSDVTLNDQFRSMPVLLKVSEVATFTSTHERTVRRWIRDGRLPAVEHPSGLRVPRRALWRFLGPDFALSA